MQSLITCQTLECKDCYDKCYLAIVSSAVRFAISHTSASLIDPLSYIPSPPAPCALRITLIILQLILRKPLDTEQ
ncbi:hypothetical protein AFLA_010659 [Aspergillus flavus NRRL3357]|nr:hypothetical protein AFLA_010659 [Aspergillus flavus NRRL3357]